MRATFKELQDHDLWIPYCMVINTCLACLSLNQVVTDTTEFDIPEELLEQFFEIYAQRKKDNDKRGRSITP